MAKNKINFTKAVINNLPLPAASKRLQYYDTKTPHLLVRVSSTGRKTFHVYRWHQGKPFRVTIGVWPELTVEEIRKEAEKINADFAQGFNPSDKLKKQRQEITFNELFEIYLNRHSKPKKRTWKEDQRYYERHLKESLGYKRISTVTNKDISTIHARIGKEKPTHANRVLALISSVFGRAAEFGLWMGINPCLGIKRFPEKSRDRFLSSDELQRFFSALQKEPNRTIRDFLIISLLTGARRSNVLAMRWDQIDWEEQVWRIPETKNGTPQRLPLVTSAIEVIKARHGLEPSPFVFPGRGKTGHLVEPKKAWIRICENAEIKGVRMHDLRRTMGSWQAKTGASLPIIGKSLNHKNPSTTSIYARLDLDPVRSAMENASQAMLEAAKRK